VSLQFEWESENASKMDCGLRYHLLIPLMKKPDWEAGAFSVLAAAETASTLYDRPDSSSAGSETEVVLATQER
jgi:hypothetical protein